MKVLFLSLMGAALLLFGSLPAYSSTDSTAASQTADGKKNPGVRYKKGDDIDFEALVIQGQLKRPDVTVVTGNVGNGSNGLLRLRDNFLDRTAMDIGEEIQP